uniref:Uncharacterized protein n=1 Tax=Arion vulgaris TaxID=1028688 RepID=A0A0B6YRS5_9EUPU
MCQLYRIMLSVSVILVSTQCRIAQVEKRLLINLSGELPVNDETNDEDKDLNNGVLESFLKDQAVSDGILDDSTGILPGFGIRRNISSGTDLLENDNADGHEGKGLLESILGGNDGGLLGGQGGILEGLLGSNDGGLEGLIGGQSGIFKNLLGSNDGILEELLGSNSGILKGLLGGSGGILKGLFGSNGEILKNIIGGKGLIGGLLGGKSGILGGVLTNLEGLLNGLLKKVMCLVAGLLKTVYKLAQDLANVLNEVDATDTKALNKALATLPLNQVCSVCHTLKNRVAAKGCKDYCSRSTCGWKF